MYAGDNDGRIVSNYVVSVAGYWQTANGWVLGNAQRDQTDENLRKGLLWDYIRATGIYRCPSDTSTVRGRPDLLRFHSYGLDGALNNYYGAGTGQMFDQPGILRKDLEELKPANSFGFLDVSEGSIDAANFDYWVNAMPFRLKDCQWLHMPGERHLKGANLSFVDGHVEPHRWLYTPKKPHTNLLGPQAPVNDLDRRDLEWVVQRNAWWHWNVRTFGDRTN